MTTSERIRENPRAVLAANFKRIAEALRSLEEYSKLVDVWLAGRFEVLRYDIYTLEKLTMTAVAAHRSLGDAQLMVLVGGLPTLGDLTWVVGEAMAGGADVIQYREKGIPDRELLRRAREVRIVTARARVPMIMNDRPDLARLAGCDGVHLGQEDISVRDARRILGAAAHDRRLDPRPRAARRRRALGGASYLGVGPVFPSPTKEFSEPELAGLSFVRLAAETTALPWFAIGGIDEENVDRVAGGRRQRGSPSAPRSSGPTSPRRAAARLKAPPERPRSRRRPGYGPRGGVKRLVFGSARGGEARNPGGSAGRLPVGAPNWEGSGSYANSVETTGFSSPSTPHQKAAPAITMIPAIPRLSRHPSSGPYRAEKKALRSGVSAGDRVPPAFPPVFIRPGGRAAEGTAQLDDRRPVARLAEAEQARPRG